jgi:hypothetical protein
MQLRLDIGVDKCLMPSEVKRNGWVTLWTFWLNNLWLEWDKETGIKWGVHA